MSNKFNISVAVILAIICLCVQQGTSLSCYECNSHNQTHCADSKPPENLKKECPKTGKHNYTLCRKITQVIEFEVNGLPPDTRVIRNCGWDDSSYKNKCYQRSGFGGRQEVCACDTDYCNSAPKISTIALPVTIITLVIYKYFM